jgi:uncharacterized membrane protein YedE/YeeE
MALAGSCPGTVLAQVGMGVHSGYYALGGAIIGGILWTGFLQPFFKSCCCSRKTIKAEEQINIHESFPLLKEAAKVAVSEAIFVIAVGSMAVLTVPGPNAKISPIVGGLLIGLAQLFSLLMRKTLVGVSTVYEDAGNFFWWAASGFAVGMKPKSLSATIFAAGVVGGSWALASTFPQLVDVPVISIPPAQAVAGGFLMATGARMAGGCTSGHGISGVSLLSVSSLITIGMALVSGVLTATIFL